MPHFRFFERGNTLITLLLGSALVGLITALSVIGTRLDDQAHITLSPDRATLTPGETFSISVNISSKEPVNVFSGELRFDQTLLHVVDINYNTSLADLWVEKPWFSNGEGTIHFAGGTTKVGGHTGTDSLLTITFRAEKTGAASLSLNEGHVFRHDGLGTEIGINKPLDALFTITTPTPLPELPPPSIVTVIEESPSADLNGDNRYSITDVSILMRHIGSDDMRFDLNQDGSVSLKDLSVLFALF